jgi:hypothetical protein
MLTSSVPGGARNGAREPGLPCSEKIAVSNRGNGVNRGRIFSHE